jgi:hypothetical protein
LKAQIINQVGRLFISPIFCPAWNSAQKYSSLVLANNNVTRAARKSALPPMAGSQSDTLFGNQNESCVDADAVRRRAAALPSEKPDLHPFAEEKVRRIEGSAEQDIAHLERIQCQLLL